jgi:hypothetical protein
MLQETDNNIMNGKIKTFFIPEILN